MSDDQAPAYERSIHHDNSACHESEKEAQASLALVLSMLCFHVVCSVLCATDFIMANLYNGPLVQKSLSITVHGVR